MLLYRQRRGSCAGRCRYLLQGNIKTHGAIGITDRKVKAIFISHEHSDHIRGVVALAEKYNLPVYITGSTLKESRLELKDQHINIFTSYQIVNIGGLSVTAFPKEHDATDPHSFIISCRGINVGVFTDIGRVCARVRKYFGQCHAAFLEANYDDELLEKGRYPYVLKKRIRGGHGHLSNREALEIFLKCRPSFMTHLLLSHLSHDNNSPEIVQELFSRYADGVEIVIASRYKQTSIYQIHLPHLLNFRSKLKTKSLHLEQMRLFD